jgi:hypothetical protein
MNETQLIQPVAPTLREPKPAQKRVRLPGPKKLLSKVLVRLEKLIESGALTDSKRADCVIRQSEIALVLFKQDILDKRRRLKVENERLTRENNELRSKPTSEADLEPFMAFHRGANSASGRD